MHQRHSYRFLIALLVLSLATSVCLAQEWRVTGLGGGGGMFFPTRSPYDSRLMFIASDMGGTFRSVDDGASWQLIDFRSLGRNHKNGRPFFYKDKKRMVWASGASLRESSDAGLSWSVIVPEGPWGKGYSDGARIRYIAGNEKSREHILVGTDNGVWATTDTGKTWTTVSSSKCFGMVTLDDRAYVSAGTSIFSGALTRAGAVLVESAVGPDGQGKRLASLTGGFAKGRSVLVGFVENDGVYVSTNRAKSWVKQADHEQQYQILMPRHQVSVMYCISKAKGGGPSGRPAAFQISKDLGETWKDLFDMNSNVERSWVQTELSWGYYFVDGGAGVDHNDAGRVMVSTQGDFYVSENYGETWSPCMNETVEKKGRRDGSRFRSIGLEVTSAWDYRVHPNDSNKHYICYTDIGFARSEDGGKTWASSVRGNPWVNTTYAIAFDPFRDNVLFAASSRRHDIPHWTHIYPNYASATGGVVISRDSGKSWEKMSAGLPDRPVTSILIDRDSTASKLTLYAAVFGEGVFKSDNGGNSWTSKSAGLGIGDNMHVYRVRQNSRGELYALITGRRASRLSNTYTAPGGLWKSVDRGENWKAITPVDRTEAFWWPTDFAFDAKDEKTIYMTVATGKGHNKTGLYKTSDGGGAWTRLLSDKNMVLGSTQFDQFQTVAVDPADSNVIYCGTSLHGLWVSRDRGKTWACVKDFPNQGVQKIRFDRSDKDLLVVTTFGSGVWIGKVR